MFTIELNALKFHAFHGLYEGESIVGNDFEVSLAVTYKAPDSIVQLSDTIDYGALFLIVQQKMLIPVPLLEQVAQDILQSVKEAYPQITQAVVKIYKLQAPIQQLQGNVGVILEKQYHP